ncbi:MAG: hypothetical protein SGJ27_28815 [Candidatus Melainabacteria bacterium]|nr:hypothetical protein [Candidatus Melainabacteria bacterium]
MAPTRVDLAPGDNIRLLDKLDDWISAGEMTGKALELAFGDATLPDEQILSPQTTGDLIGRAIRVYRANIRQWAPLLIWPTVCVLIGRVIYQQSLVVLQKGAGPEALLASGGLFLALVIVVFGKWWLFQKQLSFVRLSTGFSATLDDALAFMKKRRWSMIWLMLLGGFMLTAVVVLWSLEIIAAGVLIKILPIPGILGTLFGVIGMSISTTFMWFALGLSLCALSCEKGSATDLLSRGFTLASKYFWRTMLCGLVMYLTVNLLATPLWMPVMVGGTIDYLVNGNMASSQGLPMHWQILVAAWETLVEMVTSPILCLAYGFYYYDLRLRNEGVDVLESLAALKLKQNALDIL